MSQPKETNKTATTTSQTQAEPQGLPAYQKPQLIAVGTAVELLQGGRRNGRADFANRAKLVRM